MKITSFIDQLISLNIKVHVQEGELKVTGSKESLSAEVVEKIRMYKDALKEYLQSSGTVDYMSSNIPLGNLANTVGTDQVPDRELAFSLFYFGNAGNEDENDKYRLFIEGAKFADNNGFSAVWTPERHFNEFGGLYPSPSVLAAAIALITSNIQIRAGSVVIPLHDPLRVAEEWSVIDNLSGGRVAIACAPGWQSNDFVLSPANYKDRHKIMYQKLDMIRRLWRGEYLSLPDGNDSMKDTRIFPRPLQQELPLWITSKGNIDTFRSAGQLGLNVLTHLLGETVEELAFKIAAYRKAYRDNNHPEGKGQVTLMLHTCIGDDRNEIYQKTRLPFTNYLRTSLGLVKQDAINWGYDIDSDKFAEQDLEDLLNYSFYRYVSQSSLIGSKDDAMRMLSRVSKIGVDEIACLIDFGVDHETTMKSLGCLNEVKDAYNTRVKHELPD